MPKIPVYNQRLKSQGGAVASDVNIQAAGAPGRALQRLGQGVQQLGNAIHKRDVQKDNVEAYTELENLRLESQMALDEGIRKGDVDSLLFMAEYEEKAQKIGEKMTTRQGQDFFNKANTRLNATFARDTGLAEAKINGEKTTNALVSGIEKTSIAIRSNPESLSPAFDSYSDTVDALLESGVLPDLKTANKLKESAKEKYGEAAVIGIIRRGEQGPETARQMLEAGVFDEFIKGAGVKDQLLKETRRQEIANDVDRRRGERLQKDNEKAQATKWMNNNLEKLHSLSLTTKDILNSPMKPTDKTKWINMLKKQADKALTKTNPYVYSAVQAKILADDDDPEKITDISQILDFIGPNGITATDAGRLKRLMRDTPEGEKRRVSRKNLLKFADSHLTSTSFFTGVKDPDGEERLNMFMNALMDREDELRKEGKDPGVLYDPKSKDYFGNRVFEYKRDFREIMNSQKERQQVENPPLNPEEREKPEDMLKDILKDLDLGE